MLIVAARSADANCRDDITPSTPEQDFTIHNNGTVTHNTTGLMWMRCSLGQNWDGSTCSGTLRKLTWSDALDAIPNRNFVGYNDWRLPNKNELASIVERRCINPAINNAVFPNTPSATYTRFWSSSPAAESSYYSWFVGFGSGVVSFNSGNNDLGNVRLVRAGQ